MANYHLRVHRAAHDEPHHKFRPFAADHLNIKPPTFNEPAEEQIRLIAAILDAAPPILSLRPASEDATRADLASHIAAVMQDARTPDELHNAMQVVMESWVERVQYSPEVLRIVLAGQADDQSGDHEGRGK